MQLPTWARATIDELEAQLDRLRSGHACDRCKGAGAIDVGTSRGIYAVACAGCDGSGISEPEDPP